MDTNLAGRTILIVEDEALIALDIADSFRSVGAAATVARSLAAARKLVEQDGIAAAIADFGLRDGNANDLCELLNQKHVPFVLHSGYAHTAIACKPAAIIPKPANPIDLVDAVGQLLRSL
jgi:DNA-binding response OmpR family regulator